MNTIFPEMATMTLKMANQVFMVLHEECGANKVSAEMFVVEQTSSHPTNEWRFQGQLGFGGKFWRNDGRWYVGCYKEDRTPEREEMMERANARLAKLFEGWKASFVLS